MDTYQFHNIPLSINQKILTPQEFREYLESEPPTETFWGFFKRSTDMSAVNIRADVFKKGADRDLSYLERNDDPDIQRRAKRMYENDIDPAKAENALKLFERLSALLKQLLPQIKPLLSQAINTTDPIIRPDHFPDLEALVEGLEVLQTIPPSGVGSPQTATITAEHFAQLVTEESQKHSPGDTRWVEGFIKVTGLRARDRTTANEDPSFAARVAKTLNQGTKTPGK